MSWTKEEWLLYLPLLQELFKGVNMLDTMLNGINQYNTLPTENQKNKLRELLVKYPDRLERVMELVHNKQGKNDLLSTELRRKFKESSLPLPEKNKYTLKVKMSKADKFDQIFKDL